MKLTAEKIAELFGVEVGEQFIARKGSDILKCEVTDCGQVRQCASGYYEISLLRLCGAEIEKLPWKPKQGEYYFYPLPTPNMVINTIFSDEYDQWRLAHGLCFETKEEAEAKWRELYGVTE